MGNYIFTITDKSPKKFRFTLVAKLQQFSIDILENLYRANCVYVHNNRDTVRIERRKAYQKEAYVSLKLLAYFAWMAAEQQCILKRQYSQIARYSAEVTALLIAWAKSDKKR